MAGKAKAVPEGYHTVTPYLIVDHAAQAIEFYKRGLGAEELLRLADPSGKIRHAEVRIGDSPVMLADEFPEMHHHAPRALGGSPVTIHLYVEDADKLVGQAVAAGATVVRPVADQFYGDRSGSIADPFGHVWHIATHKEDVPADELSQRARAAHERGKT